MTRLTRRAVLLGGGILAVGAAGAAYVLDIIPREHDRALVFATDGVAIHGTDPVGYFREGRPVQGDPAIAAEWKGAEWHFATAENRDAFLADPEAFAPKYGGFCAWAVAEKGELYSTQPENWAIVDGQLYLNFNDDVQERWEKDVPYFIVEGDRRWFEIVDSL